MEEKRAKMKGRGRGGSAKAAAVLSRFDDLLRHGDIEEELKTEIEDLRQRFEIERNKRRYLLHRLIITSMPSLSSLPFNFILLHPGKRRPSFASISQHSRTSSQMKMGSSSGLDSLFVHFSLMMASAQAR